jgi:hypothetical protein
MESIDLILIPENNGGQLGNNERERLLIPRSYNLKILSKLGKILVERKEEQNQLYYKYSILDGIDPLSYKTSSIKENKWISQEEWLKLTHKLEYPDLFHRLFGSFDCIHAPNLVLIPREDYNFLKFGPPKEIFKQMRNYQTHDGPYKVESVVPLTLSGPGIKKGYEIPFGRNIDILPTILKAAKVQFDEELVDGRPLF